MGRGMIRAAVLLLVFALALAVMGGAASDSRRNTKSKPQRISCARLAAEGPGDNAFVSVVGFRFGDLAAQDEPKPEEGWSRVAWPLLVEPEAKGTGLPVIAVITIRDEDFDRADHWKKLTGIVTREALAEDRREILAGAYPGLDFSDCYHLRVGDRPMPAVASFFLYAFSGLFFATAVIVLVVHVRSTNRRVATERASRRGGLSA